MINPVFAISAIWRRREPKTIALGGVATGIMNAMEAEMVAGSIRSSGSICHSMAKAARIGRKI